MIRQVLRVVVLYVAFLVAMFIAGVVALHLSRLAPAGARGPVFFVLAVIQAGLGIAAVFKIQNRWERRSARRKTPELIMLVDEGWQVPLAMKMTTRGKTDATAEIFRQAMRDSYQPMIVQPPMGTSTWRPYFPTQAADAARLLEDLQRVKGDKRRIGMPIDPDKTWEDLFALPGHDPREDVGIPDVGEQDQEGPR